MYGYVYKTTFLETGLYYVGQHKASAFEPNKYLGSGTIFLRILNKQKKLAKKRGEKWDDVWSKYFSCEMLQECNSHEELSDAEEFWVDELNACDRSCGYNITPGGWGGGSPNPSEETRRKLSAANKDKICVHNEYECIKIHRDDLPQYLDRGYKSGIPPYERSEEYRNKVSQTLTGYRCVHIGNEKTRIPADELEYYLSLGYELGWPKAEKPDKPHGPRKGMVSPEGEYRVIAESEHTKYLRSGWVFGAPKIPPERIHYGIRPSEETRKKLSESHKGKRNTAEAIQKQADKMRGRIVVNKAGEKKYIYKDELDTFIANGWVRGGLSGSQHPKSKPVICYETGEEFASMNLVLSVYPKAGALKKCLTSKHTSTCCGLHWYYRGDEERKALLEKDFPKNT